MECRGKPVNSHNFLPFCLVPAGGGPGGSKHWHCIEACPRTAGLVPIGRSHSLIVFLEAWGTKAKQPHMFVKIMFLLALPPSGARPKHHSCHGDVWFSALVPQLSKKTRGQKTTLPQNHFGIPLTILCFQSLDSGEVRPDLTCIQSTIKATAALTRVLAICNQGLSRRRKSSIFGV